jgi:two-component system sensor histidine kinase/response regulator
MTLGADDYITKPFSRDELLRAIETRLLKQDLLVSKAQKKLSELRSSISQSLPHELLGPLSIILGHSEQLLLRLPAEAENSKTIQDVTYIHDAAQKLLRSIQRYLLYADLELILADGDRLARARETYLSAVKDVVVEIAGAIAASHGRDKDLVFDLEESPIRISEVYLQKIIEELLDNAVKYSNRGSPIEIVGRLQAEKNNYQFIIKNYGQGMTPEQIASIGGYIQFDRKGYERSGLGLGLEIVKELAEIHSGAVSIESQPGQYTMVEVLLPVAPISP